MAPLPVSVVIPAYNSGETLPRALASVAAQLSPPSEVVVVDDGSDRGELAELPLASAAGVVPVRLERIPHGGPSRARNHGVAAARHPWIAFLDADDAWEPDKLSRQWAVVAAASVRPALVTSDWQRFGAPRPRRRTAVPRLFRDGARRILWINRFQTSTVLAPRDLILETGGFDAQMDGAEDWDLWTRLAARGVWAHLPLPLTRYADNPAGVSKDLARLYHRGLTMLERYREGGGDPLIARHAGDRTVIWHHLRFAWAFSRIGQPAAAHNALRGAWKPGRRWAAAWVAATALLPFLCTRLLRRVAARP